MDNKVKNTSLQIGKSISRRRQELGLTQEALAERIDVTCQQVQRYEYGKNRLNVENLQLIAKALNVSVTYFFPEDITAGTPPMENGLAEEELRVVELFRGIGNSEVRELVMNMLQAAAAGGKGV